MSTYLEGIPSKLLDRLKIAKDVTEQDKEAIGFLEEIEHVLDKLKNIDLLNRVDFLLKSKAATKTDQTENGAEKETERTKEKEKEMELMKKKEKERMELGQNLVYQVRCFERRLDNLPNNSMESIKKLVPQNIVKHIDEFITQVQEMEMPKPDMQEISQQRSTLGLENRFGHQSDVISNIRRSYEDLEGTELKVCLLSFSIFPENSAIRKRPLIYWWIGEGFITSIKDKRAEEIGEEIFAKLLRKDLIQPVSGESNCDLRVKNCKMHPWIRRMLISLAREARLFDFDSSWPMMPSDSSRRSWLVSNEEKKSIPQDKPDSQDKPIPQGKPVSQDKSVPQDKPDSQGDDDLLKAKEKEIILTWTVFNVNVQYLNLKQEWLEKLKRVEVLQLGRWQSSPVHHIEVENQRIVGSQAVGFLNGLGSQKHLKYLSLRGISRINQLPDSIRNLISLEILDLRACHDLERLPSDISSLKRLTHFDVAECYLLEGMPKGIQKLKSLQVLKGFLVGSVEKTTSKLGDLSDLKKLRRLSIHMGNEAAVQSGELKRLKDISSLRRLKISWGAVSRVLEEKVSKELLFPPDLEKLDLQACPLTKLPEGLKPSNLKKLKKLYISGGELVSLDRGENPEGWKEEILHFRYLKKN